METLAEYLKELSTEELMGISKESESLAFNENSIVRQLIFKYNLAKSFHIGLIVLRSALLTEINRRYFGPLT
jgi:hypothetical protein